MSARVVLVIMALQLVVPTGCSSGTGVGDDPDGGTDAIVEIDGSAPADADVLAPDADVLAPDADVLAPDADVLAPDAGAPDAMPPPPSCITCHGDVTGIAPPFDTRGNTATTDRGVGAHRSHLQVNATDHRDVQCEDCHIVPVNAADVGHFDSALPAELTWSSVATADGAAPSFDGTTTTCSGVYCHGSTLAGGTNTTPNWTNVLAGEASCGSCHSIPPPGPHPADSNCSTCHPTVDAAMTFLLPQRHIDGVVDVNPGTLSCTTCHGGGTSPAPPRDASGNVATTARGVGAHRSHLGTSVWHKEVTCDACHTVPTAVSDVGHNDTALPAELTWGPLAVTDGALPSFDGATTTCSSVYCHGSTLLSGGSNTTPNWAVVGVAGNAQAACGTCHGLPPASPHPASGNCSSCHPTIAADMTFPDPSRHIDGVVDVINLDCTSCHGDVATSNPAPPRDTTGKTATSARGVGAHKAHLGPSVWRAPIACSACHIRPTAIGDTGHTDSALPAELTWGMPATADGATPGFDGTTCSGVYCHGSTLITGGSNTTPTWTSVGTGEADCGTCHGLPPAGVPHPQNTNCSSCHTTVAADNTTFLFPNRHVDGVVDLATLDCTSCHGDVATNDPAPPSDTRGNVATTARGVGAHQSHLGPSTWRAAIDCTECHIKPASVSAPGHRDSALPAELTFGGRATADSATPSFNGATTTCSGVYCHGATLQPGGTNTTPDWTSVGTGEADCGTCHSLPPGGTHTSLTDCQSCHGSVINAAKVIIAPNLHVDGTVQVTSYHPPGWSAAARHGSTVNNTGYTSCQGCHGNALTGGTAGVSCDSCHNNWKTDCTFCHGGTDNITGAPPEGIDGELTRTLLAVGAHTEHVSTTNMHLAWNCDKCHTTPASAMSAGHIDGDGRAEVKFDWLNPAATYSKASGTCGSLYCHGNGSSTLGSMVWSNNPVLDCGSCHADFSSRNQADLEAMSGKHDKHVRKKKIECWECHEASIDAAGNILRLDRHVDGIIDVNPPTNVNYDPNDCGAGKAGCTPSGCHGQECW